jgi:hypothetical protein
LDLRQVLVSYNVKCTERFLSTEKK